VLRNGTSVLLRKPLVLQNTRVVLKTKAPRGAVALKVHLGVSYDAQNKRRLSTL